MNNDQTFLAAIAADPDRDLPKMIYADWLEEHGRDEEAHRWRSHEGVPPELDDGNWQCIFAYAGETGGYGDGMPSITAAPPTSDVPLTPFTRRDVKCVLGKSDGEKDERNWLCLGELYDGRFFTVDSGCDYTGWG